MSKETGINHDGLSLAASQFGSAMEEVAPDLKSYGLAREYSSSLFNKLTTAGAKTEAELLTAGEQEFYSVGRYVLGPLAVNFVDGILSKVQGKVIFPARDATPFYYAAKSLKALNPSAYSVEMEDILNPVFNRKLWGIEDEQDSKNELLSITHPLVQKLLRQMGFFSSQDKTFIEVGCWGSMVDQLNEAMQSGGIPKESFSVYFLYTHIPDYIYGFANIFGNGLPEEALETIADTWEAFPKFFKRPTNLVEKDGAVSASLEGKEVKSPFLKKWTEAALLGIVSATQDFVDGKIVDPHDELVRLWGLASKAELGDFTGVLPRHTETWSEGEAWKANWKWGKIPPLK